MTQITFRTSLKEIASSVLKLLSNQGIADNEGFVGDIKTLNLRQLTEDENKLLLANSISPLPLHKILVLLNYIKQNQSSKNYNHQLLALANALVYTVSNLRFGPEVGIGKPKIDVPVVNAWLLEIEKMTGDLQSLQGLPRTEAKVFLGDARDVDSLLAPKSIDAVITSPPYPNEKDYTRITRLESVILGFITNRAELQSLKRGLVRSNTRNVYKGDDDDKWILQHPEIQLIADKIEKRRIELGKTSGFEKLYGKVTKLYFGGMARHLSNLRTILRPNAQLAYVVGDQASYLRVMIHTGQLLGDIAQALGYELVRTDLFRTRFSTATKEQLREEVIILKWRG